jgi:hypothetical protein
MFDASRLALSDFADDVNPDLSTDLQPLTNQ